jgi:hypothetical protein
VSSGGKGWMDGRGRTLDETEMWKDPALGCLNLPASLSLAYPFP